MAERRRGPVALRSDISAARESVDRRVRRYRAWAYCTAGTVFLVGILLGVRVGDTGVLLAALGLLSASLLGVFTQLAMWRSRLSERAARFKHTEEFDRSRIDGATSLTLRTSVVALGSTMLLALPAIKVDVSGGVAEWVTSLRLVAWLNSDGVEYWVTSVFTSVVFASLAWIFVSVVFITADLWTAYRRAATSEEDEARAAKAHKEHKRDRGVA